MFILENKKKILFICDKTTFVYSKKGKNFTIKGVKEENDRKIPLEEMEKISKKIFSIFFKGNIESIFSIFEAWLKSALNNYQKELKVDYIMQFIALFSPKNKAFKV